MRSNGVRGLPFVLGFALACGGAPARTAGGVRTEPAAPASAKPALELPAPDPPLRMPPDPPVVPPDGVRVEFKGEVAWLVLDGCRGRIGPGTWVEFAERWDLDKDGREEIVVVVRTPEGAGATVIVDVETKRLQFRAGLSSFTTARRNLRELIVHDPPPGRPPSRFDDDLVEVVHTNRFGFQVMIVSPAYGCATGATFALDHDAASDRSTLKTGTTNPFSSALTPDPAVTAFCE